MTEAFLWPAMLVAVVAVPAVVWMLRRLDRASARRTESIAGPRLRHLAPGNVTRGRTAIFSAGLALALVALAGPVWGESERDLDSRGVDVVLCLDVSRSMLARDVAPNRLDRARADIASLAAGARGDRIALVAFAGEARMLVPLTRDGATLAEIARTADPTSVGRGGTDLGAALETALAALEGGSGEHETIVLVTDGEDIGGAGLSVAERCRARGIAVHCVGVGTALGSKIAVDGPGGPAFLRDRTGAEVVTSLDASSLRRVAEATGGAYVDAATTPDALVRLREDRIEPMARKSFDSERRRRSESRYQVPLLGALLLWLLDACLPARRRLR